MSLVTGIDLGSWSAAAAEQAKSQVARISLDSLYDQGLPGSGTNQQRATFELSVMQPCSMEEYAFSMAAPAGADANHGAWTFRHEGVRIVVPALALIRALIGEHPSCFCRLFRPQSLDDIFEFSPTEKQEQGRASRLLGPATVIDRAELRRRLTWFACFPSARLAWASVLGFARAGRLDISLPKLTVNGWFRGNRYMNNFYTTKLQIKNVIAGEAPFEFASHCPTEIDFIGDGKTIEQSMRQKETITIPTRDGQSSLTDEEWDRVRPLFSRDPSQEASRRELLDAMLLKWAKNLSWRELERQQGKNEGTTSAAYYRLRIDGRFAELLNALKEMRSGGSSAEAPLLGRV